MKKMELHEIYPLMSLGFPWEGEMWIAKLVSG